MQPRELVQALNLSGVVISAAIDRHGLLHTVGGEYEKVIAALFDKARPRIHTVVFAKDQDLSAFDLIPGPHRSFFRERQPQTDFVIITAESVTEAIELVRLRHELFKAGDLSGNLPERDPDFVGRARFFEHLEAWIRNTRSGYLVLVGGVGIGKTTLLSEFVHRLAARGERPVRHFIGYHPSATGRPSAVAQSLYQQLRVKYAVLEPAEWEIMSAEERLEKLLREHVALEKSGEPEVLYIDAADQAEVASAEFLLPGALRELRAGVLCVITSRHQLSWLGTRIDVTRWEWART
jgi:hypothetical protein